jgi:hypothetical protein
MSDMYGMLAGIAFVILAATNVVLMLEASRPARSVTTSSRLLAVHRASGTKTQELQRRFQRMMDAMANAIGIGQEPEAPGGYSLQPSFKKPRHLCRMLWFSLWASIRH